MRMMLLFEFKKSLEGKEGPNFEFIDCKLGMLMV